MKEALIVVDMQDDVPDLRPILQPIQNLISEGPDIVVVTRRVGVKLNPKVRKWANFVISIEDSDALTAFRGGTLRPIQSLEDLLEEQEIKKVIVCGIVVPERPLLTFTALDSVALGYLTHVSEAATGEVSRTTQGLFNQAGVVYE